MSLVTRKRGGVRFNPEIVKQVSRFQRNGVRRIVRSRKQRKTVLRFEVVKILQEHGELGSRALSYHIQDSCRFQVTPMELSMLIRNHPNIRKNITNKIVSYSFKR